MIRPINLTPPRTFTLDLDTENNRFSKGFLSHMRRNFADDICQYQTYIKIKNIIFKKKAKQNTLNGESVVNTLEQTGS